jgi:hypothetical protein
MASYSGATPDRLSHPKFVVAALHKSSSGRAAYIVGAMPDFSEPAYQA